MKEGFRHNVFRDRTPWRSALVMDLQARVTGFGVACETELALAFFALENTTVSLRACVTGGPVKVPADLWQLSAECDVR
jgi:hypothetical protein